MRKQARTPPAFIPAHFEGASLTLLTKQCRPGKGHSMGCLLPGALRLLAGVGLETWSRKGIFLLCTKTSRLGSGESSACSSRSYFCRLPDSFGSLMLYAAK